MPLKKAFKALMSVCGVATEKPRVAPDELKAEAKARRKAYRRRKAAKAARKRTRK